MNLDKLILSSFFLLPCFRGFFTYFDLIFPVYLFCGSICLLLKSPHYSNTLCRLSLVFLFCLFFPSFLTALTGSLYSFTYLHLPIVLFENIYYIPFAFYALFLTKSSIRSLRSCLIAPLILLTISGLYQLAGFAVPITKSVSVDPDLATFSVLRLSGFADTSTPFAYILCFAILILYVPQLFYRRPLSLFSHLAFFASLSVLLLSLTRAPFIYAVSCLLVVLFIRHSLPFIRVLKRLHLSRRSLISSAFLAPVIIYIIHINQSFAGYVSRLLDTFSSSDPGNIDRIAFFTTTLNNCLYLQGNPLFGAGLGSTSRFLGLLSGESMLAKILCEFGFWGLLVIVFIFFRYSKLGLALNIAFLILVLPPILFLQIFTNPAMTVYYLAYSVIIFRIIEHISKGVSPQR